MNWLETIVGTALYAGCYYLGSKDGAQRERRIMADEERDAEIRKLREELERLRRSR